MTGIDVWRTGPTGRTAEEWRIAMSGLHVVEGDVSPFEWMLAKSLFQAIADLEVAESRTP